MGSILLGEPLDVMEMDMSDTTAADSSAADPAAGPAFDPTAAADSSPPPAPKPPEQVSAADDPWADPFDLENAKRPQPWTTDPDGRMSLSEDVAYPGESLAPGRVLMVGMEGKEITWLQGRINNLRIMPPIPVDGVYSNATFEAVKRFQTALGITASGIVDEYTLGLLDRGSD